MTANRLTQRTRQPSGRVPWPLILLEGDEGAGKSLAPAVLSADPRVGTLYWIDLGEGSMDEYGAVPDANYQVVEHDGSYRDILAAVGDVWEEADRAAKAGEPPVGIVVDSVSALWTMLVNWTNDRARRSKGGKKKLQEDPDAEIDPTMNLWNDATARWYRVMDLLRTFPGIAIVTARGKEVSAIDATGRPIEGRKEWKVEGQKGLTHDVSAAIRMTREPRLSTLTKVRSLRVQVPEGKSKFTLPTRPVGSWQVLDLAAFVFDILGCNPGETTTRDLTKLRGDDLEGLFDEIKVVPSEDDLKAVYDRVKPTLTPDQLWVVNEAVNERLASLRNHDASQPASQAAPQQEQAEPSSDAEKLRAAHEQIAEREHRQDEAVPA